MEIARQNAPTQYPAADVLHNLSPNRCIHPPNIDEILQEHSDIQQPYGFPLLIVIDALAASSLHRLNKTIQITNTGIHPGSGVGNNRKELSYKTLNIPVIAIGVPTVVDATTIVTDTFKYMEQQFSYKINNQNNKKNKLIPEKYQDYRNENNSLSINDKKEILGEIGILSEEEFKQLIYEVLSPINYNLMVTPTEIDFIIEKLGLLIGNGINKTLHKDFK